MKLRKRMVIIAAAVIMCFGAQSLVFAASDFIIRDYDIHMVVNEDDTYQITETIDVEFTEPSHGIYRTIPLKTRLDRDGQVSQFNAAVKNFEVLSGQEFSDESDSETACFKIGDPDQYTDTHTQYQFKYVYDTGGDHFKGGDEVFHNMVGTAWEAQSIDHISFEITFPQDIDMSKAGIKTGANVTVPFDAPDARTIRGETTENVLGGLTVRAVLPEGYFAREAANKNNLIYALAGMLCLLAAVGIVLWRRYGCDPVYPVTLQFYPPDNLSAPEAAYLLKGDLDNRDVISMLLSLADKGYIKIHEEERTTGRLVRKTKSDYTLEKLRDYDGSVIEEHLFMDGLFSGRDTVRVEELKNSFYKTVSKIVKSIREKYKGMLFDPKAASLAKLLYCAGAFGYALLFAGIRHINGQLQGEFITVLIFAAFASLGGYMLGENIKNKKRFSEYIVPVIMTVSACAYGFVTAEITQAQLLPAILGAVFCLLLFILGGLCEKKTEYYAKLQAEIRGFTDFLRTAEKDQMEAIAERDPEYYYRNLAYAFALGVTAVYAKRFARMVSAPPEWYESYHMYNSGPAGSSFLDSINSMADSVSTVMTSSPSDGGGGGSFSGGGGGGGGGGGSW